MPSLASMRSVDPAGDSMQPLGPPIRETQHTPVPLPKPTGTPGVYKAPDGKLVTAIPENERAHWPRLFSAPGEYDVETSP